MSVLSTVWEALTTVNTEIAEVKQLLTIMKTDHDSYQAKMLIILVDV